MSDVLRVRPPEIRGQLRGKFGNVLNWDFNFTVFMPVWGSLHSFPVLGAPSASAATFSNIYLTTPFRPIIVAEDYMTSLYVSN